jgi:proteasome alpha subunit
MSMPFYVSPEQLMKDRADFARKGIGRGRSLAVVQYSGGIVFVSENLSQALHKVSEIYDRIAFAAVGRYNEFENLRIAGVRLADMRGYAYDRRDVTGRALANAYAQTLGTIFSSGGEKPYEVEIFVAEVGDSAEDDQIYRLTYDGQVADEHGFAVMGGSTDKATSYLKEHYAAGAALDDTIRLAVQALGQGETETRSIPSGNLEIAVLDRTRSQQRKFKRLAAAQLQGILGNGSSEPPPGGSTAPDGPSEPSTPDEPPAPASGEAPPIAPPID